MGFLTEGETLIWDKAKPLADYIREHGITQLLNIWQKHRHHVRKSLLWGDEIEYILAKLDPASKSAKLLLNAKQIIDQLPGDIPIIPDIGVWKPEYGRHMVEGTPGGPYTGDPACLHYVEINMARRRAACQKLLGKDEYLLTIVNFPLMGVGAFTEPAMPVLGDVAASLFTPDTLINEHHRFSTLTRNIRLRRGANVDIHVPLFRDANTPPHPRHPDAADAAEPTDRASPHSPLPFDIYMDSMAFGMGCCCLQTTLQCCNISEARLFYDQLSVLCPIVMSMTAACPIFRGFVSDWDVRWGVIAGSVDDRSLGERGINVEGEQAAAYVIPKSRYESISTFISGDNEYYRPEYNDIDLVLDPIILQRLVDNGMDERLARHFAHLFIRDPLVIYDDKVELDDTTHNDHFENIQSTNWQTMRFKPPPPESPIGWRVEFRSMEVQLTDFENAAFSIFVVLATRAIVTFDLNLYMPISKVDENMVKAHKRDALRSERFLFRKNITKQGNSQGAAAQYAEMTVGEIMNGSADGEYPGILPLIRLYLTTVELCTETSEMLHRYLLLLEKRASGEFMTAAMWMRQFVTSHADYKHDSVVHASIAHDLCLACAAIADGTLVVPELYGDLQQYMRKASDPVCC